MSIFVLVKVTMTVKTAPENSGLVTIQWPNVKNPIKQMQIVGFFFVTCWIPWPQATKWQHQNIKYKSAMNNATIKTAPENSGLVKVQLSNVINRSNKSNCWFLLSDMLDPLDTSNQIAPSKHQIKVCHEQCH